MNVSSAWRFSLLLSLTLSFFLISKSPVSAQTSASWQIKSVDAMKVTRDALCPTRRKDLTYINNWLDKAKELGVDYIAISTPYSNPTGTPTDCALGVATSDTISYTADWVNAIRAKGFKIWHRHTFPEFEGMYARPKVLGINYLPLIDSYIRSNPGFFAEGDIFTPIPEPQNGGIRGTTFCAAPGCQFDGVTDDEARAKFNLFLRDSMTTSESAFSTIGLGNKIKIGYFGFSGFVGWGHQHSYWLPRCGILEPESIMAMGNITIDHYPQAVGTTMQNDLAELKNCITQKVGTASASQIPIVIGEWGTTGSTGGEEQLVLDTMNAAANEAKVVGFNYWTLGPGGGNESLINADFTNRLQFDEVQSFFKASPNPSVPVKPGDLDGNGKIDIFDYNQLLTDFGKTGTNLISDIYKSGSSLNKVDIFDYNLLLTNYGK